jgi:hypothetical protein
LHLLAYKSDDTGYAPAFHPAGQPEDRNILENLFVNFRQSLVFFLICCTLLTGVSCVEVAPYRGVVYDSPDRIGRTGIREVLFEIQLLGTKGVPLSNVTVVAETKRGTDTSVTNSAGKAILHIESAQYERVEFFFSTREGSWSDTLENVPPGIDSFKAVFVLNKENRIKLKSLEY